jgi:hypothetical protein
MTPWFIATETFTPDDGDRWSKYIRWSGLTQLEEVVSLDGMLCPTILREIRDDYWPHIVNESFMLQYFLDFEFLVKQVAGIEKKNLLCVFRNPSEQPTPPPAAQFEFLGYDLVDVEDLNSALTNCGGYPDIFANSELSRFGLLTELGRALEVQARLRSLHPKDHHANCHVWAIFRAVGL